MYMGGRYLDFSWLVDNWKKMDACLLVVVGISIIHQVTALSCIECIHIVWNATDRELHIQQLGDQDVKNSWVGTVDRAFIKRALFNPACKDRDTVWFSKNYPAYAKDVLPIGTTVTQQCPALSEQERKKERCNYMHGNVEVYVKTHDKEITLDVHVRNCGKANSASEAVDDCVDINPYEDSDQKARDVADAFNDIMGFLGPGTDARSFVGKQCLCTSTLCPRPPTTQSPCSTAGVSNVVGGVIGGAIVLAIAVAIVLIVVIVRKNRG